MVVRGVGAAVRRKNAAKKHNERVLNAAKNDTKEPTTVLSFPVEENDIEIWEIEEYFLGRKLLDVTGRRVSTVDALASCDLVALCFLGKDDLVRKKLLLKRLTDFEKAAKSAAGVHLVVACACVDIDYAPFVTQFTKMPKSWYAVPSSTSFTKGRKYWGPIMKDNKVPKMVVLRPDTGRLVTLDGLNVMTDMQKRRKKGDYRKTLCDLLDFWKESTTLSLQDYGK